MFCVSCGGDVPAGSRFCPRCGRATTPDGSAPPADGPPPAPPSAPPPPPFSAPPPPPPPPPTYSSVPPTGGYGPPPGGYAPPPGAYGAPPPPPPYPGGYPGGYPGAGGGPVAYGLADFGQRIGAYIIDGIIIYGTIFVGVVIAAATAPSSSYDNPDPGPNGIGVLLMLLAFAAAFAYPVVSEGRPDGQTLGKKALGIRVVRKSNGAPLGYGLAFGRLLARFVEGFTFGLGLLWAAWDPQHQTFHDKMASTLVVKSSVYPPPGRTLPGPPGYQQPAPPSSPYPG